ncbi:MAG: hypothetical protein ABW278_10430 [Steroidobacteraceae bacterium]
MSAREPVRSLELQRQEFAARPLLATPIAGTLAWAVVGVAGIFLSSRAASLVLFMATGMIVYVGMFISRFTGENFLDRTRPKNTFDALFLYSVGMALLAYAIAIPFYMLDHTSLPLSVGVLSGMMWVPMTWILQHWIGVGHAVVRTALIVALWYLLPEHRFVAIPFAIVAVYIWSIAILVRRHRRRL